MFSLQILSSALLLGIAGSIHCAGMCGPLILAMPFHRKEGSHNGLKHLMVYHTGRILVYVLLGILTGTIGKGVAIAGIQKGLSLAAGFFLIVMAFTIWRFEFLVASIPGFARYTGAVQRMIGKAMGKQGYRTTLSLGALNGMLPCGLVYGALAGAISTMEPVGGGVFMLLFGAGTIPMLLAVSLLGNKTGNHLRKKTGYSAAPADDRCRGAACYARFTSRPVAVRVGCTQSRLRMSLSSISFLRQYNHQHTLLRAHHLVNTHKHTGLYLSILPQLHIIPHLFDYITPSLQCRLLFGKGTQKHKLTRSLPEPERIGHGGEIARHGKTELLTGISTNILGYFQ